MSQFLILGGLVEWGIFVDHLDAVFFVIDVTPKIRLPVFVHCDGHVGDVNLGFGLELDSFRI